MGDSIIRDPTPRLRLTACEVVMLNLEDNFKSGCWDGFIKASAQDSLFDS